MNKAFTLVELAIVIVIIGLLVGGVLQGQELIKQAKWRTSMKEIESHRAALATFFGKYNCIPGDCQQAFRFFSTECGTDSTATTTVGNTGCNGDGNKVVNYPEGQLAWKHLSLAKIIKGSFTEGYTDAVKTNVNVPPSSLGDNAAISFMFSQGNPASATGCGYEYCQGASTVRGGLLGKNIFLIGSMTDARNYVRGGLLTPIDAFEFDVKFDDGIYYSGAISGYQASLADEANTIPCADHTNRVYYTQHATYSKERRCRLVFDSGF